MEQGCSLTAVVAQWLQSQVFDRKNTAAWYADVLDEASRQASPIHSHSGLPIRCPRPHLVHVVDYRSFLGYTEGARSGRERGNRSVSVHQYASALICPTLPSLWILYRYTKVGMSSRGCRRSTVHRGRLSYTGSSLGKQQPEWHFFDFTPALKRHVFYVSHGTLHCVSSTPSSVVVPPGPNLSTFRDNGDLYCLRWLRLTLVLELFRTSPQECSCSRK